MGTQCPSLGTINSFICYSYAIDFCVSKHGAEPCIHPVCTHMHCCCGFLSVWYYQPAISHARQLLLRVN